MDKISFSSRLFSGGLTLLLSVPLWSQTFDIGRVSQVKNTVSSLELSPPHKTQALLALNETIKTDHSYLTNEDAEFTIRVFDNSWIRVNPSSKISFEYDPEVRTLDLNLYSGSVKILISKNLNPNGLEQITINSVDARFESLEGKFVVSRNGLTETSHVFVEKGTVLGTLTERVKDFGLISVITHTGETSSFKDRDSNFSSVRKMNKEELKLIERTRR